jgi:hypothetical protein
MIREIAGRFAKAAVEGGLSRTGAGRAYGAAASLATKEGRAEAFAGTAVGRLVGGASTIISGKEADQQGAATPITRGGASGLGISKQALSVLQSIDENLKRMVDALGLQQQKEEAAKEEAASEAETPGAVGGKGGAQAEEPGFFRKFMRLIIGLALSVSQIAMPLYETVKSAVQWMIDMGMKVFDFLSEKFLKLFTEDIPHFFVETVPDFFMNTLPEVFFSGVDFLKDKMDSILKSVNDILANIKSGIGGMIVDLADSSAAKFLLPEGMRNSIKEFGKSLQKTEPAPEKTPAPAAEKAAAYPVEAPGAVPSMTSASEAAMQAAGGGEPGKAEELEKQIEKLEKRKEDNRQKNERLIGKYKDPSSKFYDPERAQEMEQDAQGVLASYDKDIEEAKKELAALKKGGVGGAVSSGGGAMGGIGTSAAATPGAAGGVGGGTAQAMGDAGGIGGAGAAVGSMAGGTGGGTAEAMGPAGGTGGAVASASMAATAPDFEMPSQAMGPDAAKNMSKSKANPDPTNPIANVPDVFPSLGSIAGLWYHNASSIVAA